MKLTILGSGTSIPHPRRASSGYWLETSGGSILLDCSASIGTRMAAAGLDWPNLDAIWISHFHLDHCGGLAPLLGGTKHAAEMKLRTKPLKIIGPKGMSGLIERFCAVNNYRLLEQPFPVEIVEVEELEPFEILGGIEAIALKTPHTPESLGIRISDADGATFVYTADTGFTEAIIAFARNVDLLILECSYFLEKPVEKHLKLEEAMFIVNKARPKRVVLTHLYPEWDGVDLAAEAAKFDPPCEVIEAVDESIIVI